MPKEFRNLILRSLAGRASRAASAGWDASRIGDAGGGSACGLASYCRLLACSCRSCEDAAWAAWLDGRDAHKDLARERGAAKMNPFTSDFSEDFQ